MTLPLRNSIYYGYSQLLKGAQILILRKLNISIKDIQRIFTAELWDAMKKALAESEEYEIDDIANGGQRDSIYGCQGGGLLNSDFAYWECYIPIRKKQE